MTLAYTKNRDLVMVLDDVESSLACNDEDKWFEDWAYTMMEEVGTLCDSSEVHATFFDEYNGYVYTVYFDVNWVDFEVGDAYIVKGRRLDELDDSELEEIAWHEIEGTEEDFYHFDYKWEDGKKLDTWFAFT